MSRKRQTERWANKTYEAERHYWQTLPLDHPARRQVTIDEATSTVQMFLPQYTVVRGKGFKSGFCAWDRRQITLGGLAQAWIVAHEIAHGYGKMTDHHNADFRGRYVAICRALFPDAADGLRDAFTAHGMNVGPEVLPTPETTLPHPTATKETE